MMQKMERILENVIRYVVYGCFDASGISMLTLAIHCHWDGAVFVHEMLERTRSVANRPARNKSAEITWE